LLTSAKASRMPAEKPSQTVEMTHQILLIGAMPSFIGQVFQFNWVGFAVRLRFI
jgi:hypothetical protein